MVKCEQGSTVPGQSRGVTTPITPICQPSLSSINPLGFMTPLKRMVPKQKEQTMGIPFNST